MAFFNAELTCTGLRLSPSVSVTASEKKVANICYHYAAIASALKFLSHFCIALLGRVNEVSLIVRDAVNAATRGALSKWC